MMVILIRIIHFLKQCFHNKCFKYCWGFGSVGVFCLFRLFVFLSCKAIRENWECCFAFISLHRVHVEGDNLSAVQVTGEYLSPV